MTAQPFADRAAPPVSVVGSAPSRMAGLLAGPDREGQVVHAGPDAVYLQVGDGCLGVLSARATRVPLGLRTMLPVLPPVEPGEPATVAEGVVHLPGLTVAVGHEFDPTAPRLPFTSALAGAADRVKELAAPALHQVRAELPPMALDLLAHADPTAVVALLGRGSGLTPLGDDVLAGWLATAASTEDPALDDFCVAVRASASRRTTALSAALLDCACRGEALPEFQALVLGVAGDDRALVRRSVTKLLAVGATSGAGLVLGAALALTSPREEGAD